MDESHRDLLQKCSEFLINNVTPEPLVDRLYADGILSNDDFARLRHEVTTNDKNKLLLVGMLPRAGPKAFSSLVTALKDTEQSDIADHILQQLDKGRPYLQSTDCPRTIQLGLIIM